jgi:hypothetical protein
MDTRQKLSAFVVLGLLLMSDARNQSALSVFFATLEVACIALIVCGFARDTWQWLTERIKRNLWLNYEAEADCDNQ